MAKIEITKTELVWPGKYNDDGTRKEVERVSLPFQVIEMINETRATREATKKPKQKSLFDIWQAKEGDTFEEGWKNKLIWGENLLVMNSLLEKFAGKIDLIYIDPPFATGADFSFTTEIGDGDLELTKEQSILEEKAYRDTWGKGIISYLEMITERLFLMRDLLSNRGSIYVHVDYRVSGYLRLIMDEILGPSNHLNNIMWCYSEREISKRFFNRKHDEIMFYSKSDSPDRVFNCYDITEEYSPLSIQKYGLVDKDGRRFQIRGKGGPYVGKQQLAPEIEKKHPEWTYRDYLDEKPGVLPRDWFANIDFENRASPNRTGYATQKPEALLEKFLKVSSNTGDLVADFFCGSGTTLAVAEKLGRRWIGCDLSRWAIHVTRKRLLGIEDCKPFEVLNLGKYERKYWQGITFGDKKKTDQQLAIYHYLAFILKLYGAEPISGMQHLHGKKGKSMVHVGTVDAPVTIDEINACLDECLAIQQKELHVLGWEWEMGLYDLMTDAAKGRGVKLILLNIPREVMEQQAVVKGDIQFFELAYLEVDIKQEKGRKLAISLKDFVIPNTELIPEEIRSKIKKWSDYIDYWAIDWDFQNDTFMNGWVTYRTRKDRTLALKSDPTTYEKVGKYTIMVKVVDIFGNDTSQAFEVEVK
jgi:DNA modification methylase